MRCSRTARICSDRCACRWPALKLDGRRALKKLLAAYKRLNTAYLLKEPLGQAEFA